MAQAQSITSAPRQVHDPAGTRRAAAPECSAALGVDLDEGPEIPRHVYVDTLNRTRHGHRAEATHRGVRRHGPWPHRHADPAGAQSVLDRSPPSGHLRTWVGARGAARRVHKSFDEMIDALGTRQPSSELTALVPRFLVIVDDVRGEFAERSWRSLTAVPTTASRCRLRRRDARASTSDSPTMGTKIDGECSRLLGRRALRAADSPESN